MSYDLTVDLANCRAELAKAKAWGEALQAERDEARTTAQAAIKMVQAERDAALANVAELEKLSERYEVIRDKALSDVMDAVENIADGQTWSAIRALKETKP